MGFSNTKEEQAGRKPEVSAVDPAPPESVSGCSGLAYDSERVDYPVLQSSPEEPEYYLRRITRKLRHQWKPVPPGLYSGESGTRSSTVTT